MAKFRVIAVSVGAMLAGAGFFATRAQDPVEQAAQEQLAADRAELPVVDANCTFFGPQREKFLKSLRPFAKAELTGQVASQLAPAADVMTGFVAAAAVGAESANGGEPVALHSSERSARDWRSR